MRILSFILCAFLTFSLFGQESQLDQNFLRLEGDSSIPNNNSLNGDSRIYVVLKNNSVAHNTIVSFVAQAGSSELGTKLEHCAREYGIQWYGDTYAGFGQLFGQDNGIILRTGTLENPNGVIKFMTGYDGNGSSYERARFNADGFFGVGTSDPKTKLHITDGDVFIDHSDTESVNGIIMKSPGVFCFKMTIDDNGNFINSGEIACPE